MFEGDSEHMSSKAAFTDFRKGFVFCLGKSMDIERLSKPMKNLTEIDKVKKRPKMQVFLWSCQVIEEGWKYTTTMSVMKKLNAVQNQCLFPMIKSNQYWNIHKTNIQRYHKYLWTEDYQPMKKLSKDMRSIMLDEG